MGDVFCNYISNNELFDNSFYKAYLQTITDHVFIITILLKFLEKRRVEDPW